MRKLIFGILFLCFCWSGYGQVDTISTNIYQRDGKLGVGISEPESKLAIQGTYSSGLERNLIKINNLAYGSSAYTGIILKTGDSDLQSVIQDYGINYAASTYYDFGGFLNLSNNSKGLMLHANSEQGIIKFYTGHDETAGAGIERLRIDSEGRIGVGTITPEEKLDINGGIKIANSTNEIAGVMRWTGSNFEGYDGASWLSLSGSSTNQWQNNSNGVHFNEGNVGIGSNTPESKLAIQGTYSSGLERNLIKINNLAYGSSAYTGIILKTGDSDLQSVIQDYGINYAASTYYDFGGFLNLSNNSKGLMLHANSEQGIIKFYTGHDETAGAGIERLRIDSEGNIGIGTTEPKAKLEIADGDIYISDINKGIIMKSPDGQCWRGTIDNSGSFTFTQVDCPEVSTTTKATENIVSSNKNISIYPNPTENLLTIDIKNLDSVNLTYYIYDISGKLMYKGFVESRLNSIDISTLTNGVYLLNVNDSYGNQLASEKIIKQ